MSKMRFTDCLKWGDPWFMELNPEMKLLWLFLCDNCDNAGVWDVNQRLATFQVGAPIDWQMAINMFDGRIKVFASGKKWYLTKFLAFQYPAGLSDTSKPHQQVVRLLVAHGLPLSCVNKKGGGGRVMDSLSDRLSDRVTDSDQDQTTTTSISSLGESEGKSADDSKKRGQEGFVAFLKRKHLDTSEASQDEWIGFAKKCGAIGFDLATACIEWCVRRVRKQGFTGRVYARSCEAAGEEWAAWHKSRASA